MPVPPAAVTDPFGTEALRAAVLAAWSDSPTRFREDANAEEDLLLGGYADRWLVELAQNAADAARRAGRPGALLVRVTPGPGTSGTSGATTDGDVGTSGTDGDAVELRVANTGAPLDADGVAALASLRASSKRDDGSVGRFGVGFAAVLGVTGEPRIVSTTGGVRFSTERTRAEVAALPGAAPAELARRAGRPPVLRLPWPVAGQAPPDGYQTEVRLPLRPRTDPSALTGAVQADAEDLLLALSWLAEIVVEEPGGGRTVHRREAGEGEGGIGTVTLEPGGRRWLLVRRSGALAGGIQAVEDRADWSVCWALPLGADGRPDPLTEDVLHAPTPSDERLGLPARLLASLPMQPSRRRVRAGRAADEVIRAAASAYLDLVLALPAGHRAALAPEPGFPLGELDGALRGAVAEVLESAAWLPSATADGTPLLAPRDARVLEPAGPGELGGLVVDAVPELLSDAVRDGSRAALAALGVRALGPAELADRLSAVRWSPARWRAVYQALATALEAAPDALEELAALPVPLVDGRTVTGPRGALMLDTGPAVNPRRAADPGRTADPGEPGWAADLTGLDLPGLRIVHPGAAHPLLGMLGAVSAGPAELLDHGSVVAAVGRSGEEDPEEEPRAGLAEGRGPGGHPAPLARLVLGLVTELHPDGRAEDATARPWLSGLALPDAAGETRRADELMLPDAAIRPLLAPDGPLGVLDADLAAGTPRAVLTAVGVLDSFAVLVDEQPGGPDHDLADEERWWDQLEVPPSPLVAVRDLDLVDEAAWPAALAALARDPLARRALRAEDGPSYTGWWLARFARLGGHRPGHWRLAPAEELAGLFDPVPVRDGEVPDDVLAAAGVRRELTVRDLADARELLDRLGDPAREPDAALTQRAHAELADAVLAGRIDVAELDPPSRLRAVDGSVVGSDRAVLLDRPWLTPALPPGDAVSGLLGDPELTGALAELLDLPLASEVVSAVVVGDGRPVRWSALAEVVSACASARVAVPDGRLWLHDELVVELTRPAGTRTRVPYWRDGDGRWHASDPVRAVLGRLAERERPDSATPEGFGQKIV